MTSTLETTPAIDQSARIGGDCTEETNGVERVLFVPDHLDPDPELMPVLGVRIEVERHSQRFICAVKGRTIASVQGICWPTDPLFLVCVRPGVQDAAERYAERLRSFTAFQKTGWQNVVVEGWKEGAD